MAGVYRKLSQLEYKDIEQRILMEDNHYLVFNKKSGEISQGDKTGDEPLSETLKAFIAQRDNKSVFKNKCFLCLTQHFLQRDMV